MKVYGIYSGSIFEGGGVSSPLYVKKDDAIKACKKLFQKELKWHLKRSKSKDEKKIAQEERYINQFMWKKSETIENFWSNTVDCISLQEFDVIE